MALSQDAFKIRFGKDLPPGPMTLDQLVSYTGGSDRGVTKEEFAQLKPEVQQAILNDPKQFLMGAMDYVNGVSAYGPDTFLQNQGGSGDLLSIGAEGGVSSLNKLNWKEGVGLTMGPGTYMGVNDQSMWTRARDAAESAAVLAGNYFLPGSGLVTKNLASKGSQDFLSSDIGRIGMLASGGAGGMQGNMANYGKIYDAAGNLMNGGSSIGADGIPIDFGAGDAGSWNPNSFMNAANDIPPEGIDISEMLTQAQQDGIPITSDMLNAAQSGDGSSLWSMLKQGASTISGITGLTGGQMLSGGASLLGGYLQGNAAKGAAQTNADAQLRAAQIAADAAKFRPIGVTTRFGQSNFGYDANGNLISAGYNLAPDIRAQQNQMMGATGGLLNQYIGVQGATAPMGQAAQSMMNLGNQYLQKSPQEQAAQYMQEQQALLAGPRAADYARMQQQLQNTGRAGLSMGGGGGMTPSNPEMQAYYNAGNKLYLELAANATQGGQQYATYGANMVGAGGDMLKGMYGTQQAAYAPYQGMLGGASNLEGLGQQAMDSGINIGAKGTASSAQSGDLLRQGMMNAANTMQPANSYSPWATGLSNAGNMLQNYGTQSAQQQQQALNNQYMQAQMQNWATMNGPVK